MLISNFRSKPVERGLFIGGFVGGAAHGLYGFRRRCPGFRRPGWGIDKLLKIEGNIGGSQWESKCFTR
jgi:hypothetical protein